MSATIGLSTAALTDAEKTDTRRFCGYPAYGPGASGFQGWRFFQAYGLMEYRLANAAPAELQVIRGFLAELYTLDQAIPGAGGNLDTAKAAVWTRNPAEVRERAALFGMRRRELCAFLGLPPGPGLEGPVARVVV
jgi:hypothetical protein